jgi:hypothetical protein
MLSAQVVLRGLGFSVVSRLELSMGRALVFLFAVTYQMRAQEITAETFIGNLHREAQEQPVHDRLILLYDLAIAATGVDSALSAEWSLEMYDLATKDAPHEQPWQQMNQAAGRKNALTILSLTDPERAAQHFLELEPSPGHQPNEDPRIDLARHLFPRLWAKQGEKSLPTILRFADFTSLTGQYPYVAVGHILPGLAKVDRAAAHSLCLAAIHRFGEERGIWRTPGRLHEVPARKLDRNVVQGPPARRGGGAGSDPPRGGRQGGRGAGYPSVMWSTTFPRAQCDSTPRRPLAFTTCFRSSIGSMRTGAAGFASNIPRWRTCLFRPWMPPLGEPA